MPPSPTSRLRLSENCRRGPGARSNASWKIEKPSGSRERIQCSVARRQARLHISLPAFLQEVFRCRAAGTAGEYQIRARDGETALPVDRELRQLLSKRLDAGVGDLRAIEKTPDAVG